MKKFRIIALAVTVLMLLPLFTVPASALTYPEPQTAKAALIYCSTADEVLWSYNMDEQIYPASTVKLMVAILALEHFEGHYDDMITCTADGVRRITGNRISLREGEIVAVIDLISAVIIGGANDASQVLAIEIGGSVEGFVDLMNKKAQEMGMTHTVYTNPTGIHDDAMVTTLRDILTISAYAQKITRFMELADTPRYHMEGTNISHERYVTNRNYFISTTSTSEYYYSIVTGMNAGSTAEAGNCVIATCTIDGVSFIAIVMGAESETVLVAPAGPILDEEGNVVGIREKDEMKTTVFSYREAKSLLDWAITGFSYMKVVDSSTMICEISVRLAQNVDHVTLLPEKAVELFLPNDVDIANDIGLSWSLDGESMDAPVKTGDKAGELLLHYKGEVVATVPLVAKNNIERSEWLRIGDGIQKASQTLGFRIILLAAGIGIVAYVIGVAVWRSRKKKAARIEFYRGKRG